MQALTIFFISAQPSSKREDKEKEAIHAVEYARPASYLKGDHRTAELSALHIFDLSILIAGTLELMRVLNHMALWGIWTSIMKCLDVTLKPLLA